MIKSGDEIVRKSDEAKGEDTAHSHLDKEADKMAKKGQETEKKFDKQNQIFTK
jgi:hypothetical protein